MVKNKKLYGVLWSSVALLGSQTLKAEKPLNQARQAPPTKMSSQGSLKKAAAKKSKGAASSLDIEKQTFSNQPLNQALMEAYRKNSTIHTELHKFYGLAEKIPEARAAFLPDIRLESSESRGRNRSKTDTNAPSMRTNINDRQISVKVQQSLFKSWGSVANLTAASHQVKAAHYNFQQAVQEVMTEAVDAYLDLVFTKELVKLNKESLVFFKRRLQSVKAAYEAGDQTETAVAESESRLAEAEARVIEAEGKQQEAVAAYERTVGKELPSALIYPHLIEDLPKNLDELTSQLKNKNPAVLGSRYSLRAAKEAVHGERSHLLPSVDLVGSASQDLNRSHKRDPLGSPQDKTTKRDTSIRGTLQLTVPLYQRGARWSGYHRSQEELKQATFNLEDVHQKSKEKIIKIWQQHRTAKKKMERFKSQIKYAKTSRDGLVLEADLGESSLFDALEAEVKFVDAQINYREAQKHVLSSAYKILAAVGELTPERLGLEVTPYDLKKHVDYVRGRLF